MKFINRNNMFYSVHEEILDGTPYNSHNYLKGEKMN